MQNKISWRLLWSKCKSCFWKAVFVKTLLGESVKKSYLFRFFNSELTSHNWDVIKKSIFWYLSGFFKTCSNVLTELGTLPIFAKRGLKSFPYTGTPSATVIYGGTSRSRKQLLAVYVSINMYLKVLLTVNCRGKRRQSRSKESNNQENSLYKLNI